MIRAPHGAIAWTAADGWLYEGEPVPSSEDSGDLVLVVSDDGYVRGVAHYDRAPLAALLRIETDLVEMVRRLGELADLAQGLDTGLAVEVSMLKGRVRQLESRGLR